jgi:hypothetical protein
MLTTVIPARQTPFLSWKLFIDKHFPVLDISSTGPGTSTTDSLRTTEIVVIWTRALLPTIQDHGVSLGMIALLHRLTTSIYILEKLTW